MATRDAGDPPPVRPIEAARWRQLSPLLDELLECDAAARQARLVALAATDAALARDLMALLAHDERPDAGGAADPEARPPGHLLDTPPWRPGLAQALLAQAGTRAAEPAAGQPLGAYTLERELGRGGMGRVWLARRSDGRFQGQVAVKFLHAGLLGARAAARFAREGQILARLAHPHIARLLDAGIDDAGRGPYLVLEAVDGLPIDAWCEARAAGLDERVRLLLQVADAVAHAHTRLILHRDLKPSNILVTAEGQAKLLDFGVARLLEADTPGGDTEPAAPATELTQRAGAAYTPAYAAPEQVQGGEMSTATDVYALGVLAFALLGGGHPTSPGPTTPVQRLHDIVETPPRRLSDAVRERAGPAAARQARRLRGDLDTLVAKALKKAPQERYAHAGALADDLRRWLAHEPIAARPDSRGYRAAMFVRRHRLGVATAALLALSLAGGLAATLWQASEARRQREQAEGLIAFMLGDLYARLEPVGRLDVLEAVARRTLAHYDEDPGRAGEAQAQQRRARALRVLGRVTHRAGRLDEGLALMRQALALADAGVTAAPDDADWVAEQAAALRELHHLVREAGDQAAMAQLLPRLAAAATRLHALRPDDLGALRDLAGVHEHRGMHALDAERLDEAQAAFDSGAALVAPAIDRDPALRAVLGDLHGWQSRARELAGDIDEAYALMARKLAVVNAPPPGTAASAAAADDALQRNRIAHAHNELGRLATLQGRAEVAARHLATGQGLADALVRRDPDNLEWRAQRMALAVNRASLLAAQGDRGTAEALRALGAEDLRRIVVREPGNPFWTLVHAGRQLVLQRELGLAGRATPMPTVEALGAPLAAAQRLVAGGRRLEPHEQRALAGVDLALGDTLAQQGRHEAARGHWQAALERLAGAVQERQSGARLLRARLLVRLGQHEQAQAEADAAAVRLPAGAPGLAQARRELREPRFAAR